MTWVDFTDQTAAFMILSLLLYDEGTYDSVTHTYDYTLGQRVENPDGTWEPRDGGTEPWVPTAGGA